MSILGTFVSSVLLFCLVFGMSATVEMRSLRKQLNNRKALAIGVLMQFAVLPFLGFVTVKLFQLPSVIGVTLLVVTSSPGGSYSNWWCSLFNADLALSVTMTTLSTFLSVIMLPANLLLYTKWTYSEDVVDHLDWKSLSVSLVVVISGIFGGLFASYRASRQGRQARFRRRANIMGNLAGILLIVLGALIANGNLSRFADTGSEEKPSLWNQSWRFYASIMTPALLGIWVAVKLSTRFNLEGPERVAVAIEACYQNTGIATSVALGIYEGEDLSTAIGVPLFYGIVEAVALSIFCLVCWKKGWTKAPADENICRVLLNSYEVDDDDDAKLQPSPRGVAIVSDPNNVDGATIRVVQSGDGSSTIPTATTAVEAAAVEESLPADGKTID